jgi:hypothetical protein
MVWGAFSGFDKCPLVFLPQKERTASHFVQNVYEAALSGFYFMHDEPNNLILMEDGAPIHRSKVPDLWRRAHGIRKMQWPPNSPDLNPIENVWKIVKHLLKSHRRPHDKEEMIQQIEVVWNEVCLQQLQALIANMPDRMRAIIRAKGGSTKW